MCKILTNYNTIEKWISLSNSVIKVNITNSSDAFLLLTFVNFDITAVANENTKLR